MYLASGICLIFMATMVAVASQRGEPRWVFIFGTLASGLIFNAVEGGNRIIGWLLVPLLLICLPSTKSVLKRSERSPNEVEEPASQMTRTARKRTRLISPVNLGLAILIIGMALSAETLTNAPTFLQVLLGLAWGGMAVVLVVRLTSKDTSGN